MEFLCGLLGGDWKAPDLDGESGCSEEQRAECLEELGEEGLAWACAECPRRPPY